MSLDTPAHGSKAVVGRTYRYRIVRSLAKRPSSELALVYAPDGGQTRIAAMKRLTPALARDPAAAERFRIEANIAAQLDHANIVRVIEVVETEAEHFFTMEYVRGADMRQLMDSLAAQQRTLPLDCVLLVVIELCYALDYAHTLPTPVFHGEISPAKILIGHDGRVKLCGFAAPPTPRTPVRRARTASVGYTSPERYTGETLDARSDIFALGVLLYELSSGERLFADAKTHVEIMQAVLRGDMPRPSEIRRGYPRELETILMRALARDRNDRYASAAALQADLETFLWSRWPTANLSALARLVGEEFPWDDLPETTIAEPLDTWTGPVASPFANLAPPPPPPRPRSFPRSSSPAVRSPASPPKRAASDLAIAVERAAFDDDSTTIASPRTTAAIAAARAPAEPPPVPMPPPEAAKRRLWPWLIAGVAGTVIGVGAAFAIRTTKHPIAAVATVAPPPSKPVVEVVPPPAPLPAPLIAPPEPLHRAVPRPHASRKVEKPKRALGPPPDRLPVPAAVGSLDGLPAIKAIDLNGTIALDGVRKSVEQALSPLRACYRAAARQQQQTPRVQLTLAFDVGDRRVPAKIRAAGGAPLDALAPCAAKVAADIRNLPAPKGAGARVIVSLEFRPNPPSP